MFWDFFSHMSYELNQLNLFYPHFISVELLRKSPPLTKVDIRLVYYKHACLFYNVVTDILV